MCVSNKNQKDPLIPSGNIRIVQFEWLNTAKQKIISIHSAWFEIFSSLILHYFQHSYVHLITENHQEVPYLTAPNFNIYHWVPIPIPEILKIRRIFLELLLINESCNWIAENILDYNFRTRILPVTRFPHEI